MQTSEENGDKRKTKKNYRKKSPLKLIFFFSFFFGIRAVSVSLLLLLWRRGLGTNEGRKIRTKIPKEKITSYSSCKRERDEDEVWKKGEWIDDEAGRNSEGICIECDFFLYLLVIVISFRFPESCELWCRSHSRFCIHQNCIMHLSSDWCFCWCCCQPWLG